MRLALGVDHEHARGVEGACDEGACEDVCARVVEDHRGAADVDDGVVAAEVVRREFARCVRENAATLPC